MGYFWQKKITFHRKKKSQYVITYFVTLYTASIILRKQLLFAFTDVFFFFFADLCVFLSKKKKWKNAILENQSLSDWKYSWAPQPGRAMGVLIYDHVFISTASEGSELTLHLKWFYLTNYSSASVSSASFWAIHW